MKKTNTKNLNVHAAALTAIALVLAMLANSANASAGCCSESHLGFALEGAYLMDEVFIDTSSSSADVVAVDDNEVYLMTEFQIPT